MSGGLFRCAVIVCLIAAAGTVVSAQQETAAAFLDILQRAPEEARVRISGLIAEAYPDLPSELSKLIARERPNFLSDIQPDLDALVATKYPDLQRFVEDELLKAAPMQAAVDELIARKYPDLVLEIRALPPGPDIAKRAAELVRRKYPDLLQDVLVVLRDRHPDLVVGIQLKVQIAFPAFIADAGTVILAKYPELTGKIVGMVATQYPDLVGRILEIIRTAQAPPPADSAPAEEGDGEENTPPPAPETEVPPQEPQ